jgi:hypothetical protein
MVDHYSLHDLTHLLNIPEMHDNKGKKMKLQNVRILSGIVVLASIVAILIVLQFRPSLSDQVTGVLLLLSFLIMGLGVASMRLYYKPIWYGSGLRSQEEIEQDNQEMEEPYHHH